MKKIYTLVTILAASFAANAQTTVKKEFNQFGFTNAQAFPSGAIDSNISFTTVKNASNVDPAYYDGGGGTIRLYPGAGDGGSLEFTFTNNITVTDVIVEAGVTNAADATYFVDGSTTGTALVADSQGLYTISGINAATGLKFQNSANATSGNQIRVLSVTFTYTTSASTKENNIEGLNIFPNPANDVLNITSNNTADKNVQLFDLTGKKVLDVTTVSQVNVSTLKAGIYVAKINEAGKTATRKVVIK
ncbi:Por secretion system C-terminal sorting domain-containing protein [Paenimyroides ummariense]|uniref:Por secretion system C-terminal sorting domain-containing protein n=1 Tax=Paenimyroides ummariense TaxID=913024 RepID=A0A1I4WFA4_9FLAO|nr:T9SS type A sorting domain-containing protein [Paenimyroides ummariense]SFN11659.1 Por secretion system C-terminal sorting domain-containing protein [Paenimyroides ummariense]